VADKLEIDVGPVSVFSLSESALRLVKQIAQQKNIAVHFEYDDAVGDLEADERRLKQILVNLLSNAVKFTPEGGETGLKVEGDDDERLVRFTVWDTGVGISDDQIADLFEPFVQLENDLSRQQPGTGLGLVLALRLTELHNGSLALKSELGKGSRFVVSLPWIVPEVPAVLKVPQEYPEPELIQEEVVGERLPVLSVNHSSKSPMILLAEDNENLIEIYSDYLQTNDYRVITARDGLEALAAARANGPDLMLIDVQMPKMNGLEVMRRLRLEERFSTVPIIALTAHVMPADKERCLKAGANDFLGKPSSMGQIMAMIEKYLVGYYDKRN
jgi:CheY-like chemotaxis protein